MFVCAYGQILALLVIILYVRALILVLYALFYEYCLFWTIVCNVP